MTDRTVRRNQPHGIKAQQTTITISQDEMARLRDEALVKRVSVSRHVVDILRATWSAHDGDVDVQREQVPA